MQPLAPRRQGALGEGGDQVLADLTPVGRQRLGDVDNMEKSTQFHNNPGLFLINPDRESPKAMLVRPCS